MIIRRLFIHDFRICLPAETSITRRPRNVLDFDRIVHSLRDQWVYSTIYQLKGAVTFQKSLQRVDM